MKKGDLLFVYGSLRQGAGNMGLDRSLSATFIGEDSINGELYAVSWYPGAVVTPGNFDAGKPAIKGDVFRLATDEIVSHLDAYEGYPNLFNRLETETAEGRHVWVYTYNHPTRPESLIEGGDWLNRAMLPTAC